MWQADAAAPAPAPEAAPAAPAAAAGGTEFTADQIEGKWGKSKILEKQ